MIYHTLTLAAFAALRLAAHHTLADEHEWAGVVIESPAGYTVTAPQEGDETAFRLVVTLPAGGRIAAIYHTHPDKGTISNRFSPGDVAIASRMHVPSFIWVQRLDMVREYDPRMGEVGIDDLFQGSADGRALGMLLTQRPKHTCYRDYVIACSGP